jgi:hypothetical protein
LLYIGYFSFDEFGPQDEVRHGYFSCVVGADNADAAANEFKELIFSLKKMEGMFSKIEAVYMEDLIEMREIPRQAIVTRIQSSTGEFPKSVSKSLPHVLAPGISSYGWEPNIAENEGDREMTEYQTSTPFIKF